MQSEMLISSPLLRLSDSDFLEKIGNFLKMDEGNHMRHYPLYDSHLEHKLDHEENRFKVCAPCGIKISFGTRKISEFSITKNLNALIKQYINGPFDVSNSRFSTSICTSCRLTITEHQKDNLKQGILCLNKDGLGLWSEQAEESVHSEFLEVLGAIKN
ncbi:hypothetical protein TKK_0000149 [Trichogramma kaykai]